MSRPRVLVIQHESSCPPGWWGTWLQEAGCELDVQRPYRGQSLPPTLQRYDGLVVLGGEMGAYDHVSAPWLPATGSLITRAVRSGLPFFGICLGHQVAATTLGGTMRRNPQGLTRGVTPVGWLPAAAEDPLFSAAGDPAQAVHWNGDIVASLPADAVPLALDPEGGIQAARYGDTAWSVQFHPEVDAALVGPWSREKSLSAVQSLDGFDRTATWAGVQKAEPAMKRTWSRVAHRFAHLMGTTVNR